MRNPGWAGWASRAARSSVEIRASGSRTGWSLPHRFAGRPGEDGLILRPSATLTPRSMLILQEFVTRYTYAGILGALLLGSLGVPIPEEMPIAAAGILSHEGLARWWLALPMCLLGVLSGDIVLYW